MLHLLLLPSQRWEPADPAQPLPEGCGLRTVLEGTQCCFLLLRR